MTGAPRPSSAAVGAASPDVVVVGSTNADLLVQVAAHPAPGETVLGRSMAVLAGGKGANQAVAAARSGAHVAFVGSVGDDEFADAALEGLRANGVDLSGLRVVPGSTGIAIVTVSADGENSIVVIPGANAATDADAVRAQADLLARARVVVVQGEVPRDGIEEAARLARERLIVNLAPVIALDTEVLRRADPLVVNEHEAALAARALGVALPAGASDADVARTLLDAGVRSVVVTVGADGAHVAETVDGAPRVTHVPSPRVDAVDTTGAGDAFVGALAQQLAADTPLPDAAQHAARVGAYAVTSVGAQASYPGPGDELPGD